MNSTNDKQEMRTETEERARIVNHNEMQNCNVFMGDSYGGIFPLPGANVTVNQQMGPQKKTGVQTSVDGASETQEQRLQRKERVMKAIIDKMDIPSGSLGYDDQRSRITQERLALLFRRCLGMYSVPPTTANRVIMEQLWVLLIDKRDKCHKEAGEDYLRPTVLNVFGYFREQGLLGGSPSEVSQWVLGTSDESMGKNVSRGMSSAVFTDEMRDMMDFYISKLKNGEF